MFLLVGSVNAADDTEINKTKAYEWLYNQMDSWSSSDVNDVALTVLALKSGGYNISEGIDRLREMEFSGNNWGDIKDTSLATLALYNDGINVDGEIAWLKGQHVLAFTEGDWYVQIDTDYDGTCELHHEQTDIYFNFEVNDSEIISSCGTSNWIDFESCVSLVGINEDIEISCDLSGTYTSGLIFQSSDEYYLFDQGRNLDLENGCFFNSQGTCNCEYSGYGGWVLDKLGEEFYVNPYLKFKCNQNVIRNSFLYLLHDSSTTGPYSTWLKTAQWPDGSWGIDENSPGEEEYTALALLALKEKGNSNNANIAGAARWLASRQNDDGSWNNDIGTTAFILYVLYGKDYTPIIYDGSECGDGFVEDDEDCEFSSDCQVNEVCDLSCKCVLGNETDINETLPPTPPSDECGDGFCDKLGGESCSTCYLDCYADCEEEEIIEDECSRDADCADDERCNPATKQCEKKSSWVKWLVVILSVLLGVAIIYYVYMRYFSKGKKKGGASKKEPPKSPFPFKMTKQNVPARRPARSSHVGRRDSRIEKELEESLKKAKDVLKK